ncbi:MAG: HD domain-containing protein, partial [Nitrospira sp.]|nr:HD domain-containing protein [Nitrospira sp.]
GTPAMNNPSPSAPLGRDSVQPILSHEQSLRQKVGQGSEAGDIYDQQIAMLGFQLLTQLNTLIKTSRLYDRNNAALDKPVETMLTLIHTLAHDRPVTLRVQNDFFFLGDSHLKVTPQQMLVLSNVIDALNTWKIGGLTFSRSTSSDDLRQFASLFVGLDPTAKSIDDFRQALASLNVTSITIESPLTLALTASSEDGSPKIRRKAQMKAAYEKVSDAVGRLTQSAREGGTLSFKQAKRAIQNIVDLMIQDQAAMLGFTTLRCHDQYTQEHSVNVALLSMALGNRAGYAKVDLADLGLAALFHDVGKCAISLDILNKPGEFSAEEWEIMQTHPKEGVLTLVKLRGIGNVPARMAAASFEHHMNYDFSGYPKLAVPWTQSISSRIVTIADCYDAMTSSRVYRRQAMAPSKVLRLMLEKAGTSFDPTLMKLFVTCVGIIPLGSLVELTNGAFAVVLKPAVSLSDSERPSVKIIADAQGNPLDDGPELDLTDKDEFGRYRHSIARLIDQTEYKFDTSRYFL